MTSQSLKILKPNLVFCVRVPSGTYDSEPNAPFRELPNWTRTTTALRAVRSLLAHSGLDQVNVGSPNWNPLGKIINENTKVVVKPNWVYHENSSGHGLDCLITHSTVLDAVLHYVVKAEAKNIVLGDAPVQGCDFGTLMGNSGIEEIIDRFSKSGADIQIKDFRRTIHPNGRLGIAAQEGCRPLDEFILYDLGADSSLEEVTTPNSEFRVTMYNPDLLKQTHGPGRHQYLVARDIVESDVVINVPKLKTHKKACISGALKNMVGINGHKEYLPHHRKGSLQNGGDCYPHRSYVKAWIEDLLDATNQTRGRVSRWLLANAVRAGMAFGKLLSLDDNYEGSWYGNDTVWRMSLDLQRILHYGRTDGTLASVPQRIVLTVTDAIIAGQGDGPLAPTPIHLGMMTFGTNTAAVEWINALLMGLTPDHVPLTREAFTHHRYPLVDCSPKEISVFVDGQSVNVGEIFARYGRSFRLPTGWDGAFSRSPSEQSS